MQTWDINAPKRWTTLTLTLCNEHTQKWKNMGAFMKLAAKQKENDPCHDCEKIKKSGAV